MNPATSRYPRPSSILPRASETEIAAARFYDTNLVPALFLERAVQIVDAARIEPGLRVLDVACGTGVVTRKLAELLGDHPAPVGLDIAPGMLAVARRSGTTIDWRHGDADALPFDDAVFDRVLCQFGLMFFPDPVRALGEMLRVLEPGGRLVVSVWDRIAASPGSAAICEILDRIAGPEAAAALAMPFRLGDPARLREIARDAGVGGFELRTCPGRQVFPSLDLLIDAEIRGWLPIMGVDLDEDTIDSIRAACAERLAEYIDERDGSLCMPGSAHLVSGHRPTRARHAS